MNTQGKVFKYPDNVDTDVIIPARYLNTPNAKELALHCMEDIDKDFVKKVNNGDVIVAGWNFGCGSSREHAPIALLNMGAAAVVADSFARIFYRNSINLGLPLLVCKGAAEHVKNGETVELDLKNGTLTCVESGEVLQGEVFGDFVLSILEAGGIKPLFRKKFSAEE